jgi:hypothetical protein
MAMADPARWRIVDGTRPEAEVAREVLDVVRGWLEATTTPGEPDPVSVRIIG